MEDIRPEQLRTLYRTLPTGTLLFSHKPFKWYSASAWVCAFFRWVLRSGKYHHVDILRHDCGTPFLIGAKMFTRSRPVTLENWIKGRPGYIIGVLPREADPARIVAELDKPYDNAAVISKLWERLTGRWSGHTGHFATEKDWCFELIARIYGIENEYNPELKDFGI